MLLATGRWRNRQPATQANILTLLGHVYLPQPRGSACSISTVYLIFLVVYLVGENGQNVDSMHVPYLSQRSAVSLQDNERF